jgi:hypothetical protein
MTDDEEELSFFSFTCLTIEVNLIFGKYIHNNDINNKNNWRSIITLKKMEPILVIAHSIFENPPLTQFGENIVAKSSADKLTSKRFNTRIVEL